MALVSVALLAVGCRVDTLVEIDVAEDGSGSVSVTVSLDADALERVGDLDAVLALDDLEAAGWSVSDPEVQDQGLTVIQAGKSFSDGAAFSTVMDEIGPLRQFVLEKSRNFGRSEWRVTGRIDLSEGLDGLGDDDLEAVLGSAAGFDVAALEAEIGPLSEAGQLTLTIGLPASIDAETADQVTDDRAVWSAVLGDDVVDVEASARRVDLGPLLAAAVAALLVLALALVVIRRAWRRASGADRPVDSGPSAADAEITETPPDDPVDGDAAPSRRLEMIVLDALGVIFDVHDDVVSVLAPFVAENGGTRDESEVAERYRQASLGRLSTAELWAELGVVGEPDHLDREYIARIPLDDEALTFLERAKLQGLTVACLANGMSRWFRLLRDRDSLDVYIDTWLLSSDIGVRKPDPAAYEALRRSTGVALANCLMIDDRAEHLDAARRAGMSTAWLGGDDSIASDHPVLSGFESLLD